MVAGGNNSVVNYCNYTETRNDLFYEIFDAAAEQPQKLDVTLAGRKKICSVNILSAVVVAKKKWRSDIHPVLTTRQFELNEMIHLGNWR